MTLGMRLRKWNEAIKIVSLGEEYLGICRALCRTNMEPLFNGHFRTRLDPAIASKFYVVRPHVVYT